MQVQYCAVRFKVLWGEGKGPRTILNWAHLSHPFHMETVYYMPIILHLGGWVRRMVSSKSLETLS